MEAVLNFNAYPKQIEFFKAKERYVAYGGARAGGKSWAARKKAELLAMRYSGIQILLLRRSMPELRENHLLPLQKELKGIAKYKEMDKAFLFPNGSRIKLGYCDAESDVLQYQGQAYEVIFMEEATHFTEFQFKALMECNRSNGQMTEPFQPRMYFTCNPGGVGHAWVKRLFVDREYREAEDPNDYRFIQANVYDNAFIMTNNPRYVKDLETLPEARKRAMLYGEWDVFEGQYFTEFSRNIHVIDPFPIPSHWRVYRALDYGLDMLACLWIAVDELEHAYVFRELCEPDLPISTAASKILSHTQEKVFVTLAPPDLWGRSQESGRNKAYMFAAAGVPFTKSSNNREAGWMALKELLKPDANGEPALHIFANCTTLIKCLPLLQYDTKRTSDVATEPHNITHAPDALRYFAVAWHQKAEPIPVEDPFAPEESDEDAFVNYGRDNVY